MKKLFSFLLLITSLQIGAQDNLSALIPMPNQYTLSKGKAYHINNQTKFFINDKKLEFAATTLQHIFQNRMQDSIGIEMDATSHVGIRLYLDSTIKEAEYYSLSIDKKGVLITGATPGAILYGVMTMDQILLGDICATKQKQLSPIQISDAPRFERRALMLDPARNFLPIKDLKFYIDQMMKYKFNVLQLHLTDDQGWRIEIKGHPLLTSTGPFYTQEELKQLIEYAKERNIEIVPELDIPGHTVALLAVYPELGCTVSDTLPKIVGKTTNLMVCSNQEKVFTLYKEIITQVGNLFSSPYIHLGGDEAVIDKNWALCKRCQALMKENGYTKASQLMIPFFEKILSYVRDVNKRPILWCELDNIRMPANDYLFPYPKDVTMVSWRNGLTPKCLELTYKYGNEILLAPGEYAYLDYPQLQGDLPEFNNWGMPITTLRDSYNFDPGYGLPKEQQKHILGIMGTIWGEAIKDINRANYMTYPRAFSLAEAGWTQMDNRLWDSFKSRIYPNILDLIKSGVSVRAPYEIAK